MKEENLNSLAIAILLCANPIAWTMSFLPKAIVFIVVFSWLLVVFNRQLVNIIKAPFYVHIFSISTIFIFLLSFVNNFTNSLNEYFTFFIVCGITGIYYSYLKFSIKKIFHYIAIIALLLSFLVYNIDFGDPTVETVDYGMWMGVSYGILRLILALIILFLLYRKDYSLLIKLLFLGAIGLYAMIYANYASRGALLGVVFFLFGYYLIKGTSLQKKFTVVMGSLVTVLSIINFQAVISFVSDALLTFGIQVKALDKLSLLLVSGGVDNGRSNLVEKGLEGVYRSPFYGYGIAGFEDRYGEGYYVHNVFVQILYEGGIILFLPILIVFLGSLFLMIRGNISNEQKIFILFLFCSGIIELLFSNVYWKSVFFWFFIFYNIRLLTKPSLKKYDAKNAFNFEL